MKIKGTPIFENLNVHKLNFRALKIVPREKSIKLRTYYIFFLSFLQIKNKVISFRRH